MPTSRQELPQYPALLLPEGNVDLRIILFNFPEIS